MPSASSRAGWRSTVLAPSIAAFWQDEFAIAYLRLRRAVLRGGRVQGSLTSESLSRAVKKLAAR
ncbi:MAG TPA: hypothetical protein VKB76_11405, partial [Ktedonobacterales bacterium]|nr:hypothetical protein [Ktedonobacterales bacterium]